MATARLRKSLQRGLVERLYRLADFLKAPRLREYAEDIAAVQLHEIDALVEQLVEKRYRDSVKARDNFMLRWPLPHHVGGYEHTQEPAITAARQAVGIWLRTNGAPDGDLRPNAWPTDVALLPATQWARDNAKGDFRNWLSDAAVSLLGGVVGKGGVMGAPATLSGAGTVGPIAAPPTLIQHGDMTPSFEDGTIAYSSQDLSGDEAQQRFNEWTGAVLIYGALQEVLRDQQRPFFSVDTGKPHSELLATFADSHARSSELPNIEFREDRGRVVLLAPKGKQVQLSLHWQHGGVGDTAVELIHQLFGARAVRHYAAILLQLTTVGDRTGDMQWNVSQHLAALDVDPKEWRHEAEKAIEQVRAFTELEVAYYSNDGNIRFRERLLTVTGEVDILQAPDKWRVGGLRLRYSPSLYAGVRKEDGSIGTNWYPASPKLPTLNDHHYPYATMTGLRLAQRFALAWKEDQTDQIRLSGVNALQLAGIKLTANNPQRAWKSLEKTLNVLKPETLHSWRWVGGEENTRDGILELTSAQWATDRTLRGVPVLSLPSAAIPTTGAELRRWREQRKLSVAGAADRLGVARATILRAEKAPNNPLTTRLKGKLASP
jgi:DNA-binding XRE family transcriptional regulator